MRAEPSVATAAFVVDSLGARVVEIASGARGRAASVLKPLLVWAAAGQLPSGEETAWRDLGRAAVTISDNAATAELWMAAGQERLLDALNDVVGTRWRIADGGEHAALRILATAVEVAQGYAALASDSGSAAVQVRRWMREVPQDHTFGLRAVASDALGVPEDKVGVKCGWFGGERAHAVVIVESADRSVGAVALTHRRSDAETRETAQAASGDDVKLIALHQRIAGEDLRLAVVEALSAAKQL